VSRFEVKNGKVLLSRREWLLIAGSFAATVLSGMLSALNANAVLIFVVAGAALALLAALIGQATDQLGTRLGSGATGGGAIRSRQLT